MEVKGGKFTESMSGTNTARQCSWWHLPRVCRQGSGLRYGFLLSIQKKIIIIIGEIFVARKSQLDICEDAALLISMCRTTPTTRAQSWECVVEEVVLGAHVVMSLWVQEVVTCNGETVMLSAAWLWEFTF